MSEIDEIFVDTLGEVGNIMMGAGATNLAGLLGERVDITAPTVQLGASLEPWPDTLALQVEVSMVGALDGDSVFIIPADDVRVIVEIMCAGMDLPESEILGELGLSAVGEAMNQLMAGSAIALSDVLGELVDITPPVLTLLDSGVEAAALPADAMAVVFDVFVGERLHGKLNWILSEEFGQRLVDRVTQGMGGGSGQAAADAAAASQATPEPAPAAPPPAPAPAPAPAAPPPAPAAPAPAPAAPAPAAPAVQVAPAAYPELGGAAIGGQVADLALLADVSLAVTVELGRTKMQVRDVLELSEGSIVDLDRPAGAPVDILINGTLVARGDVVVVDDELGVRVSEVVQPERRTGAA